jgi:hypothetical protein
MYWLTMALPCTGGGNGVMKSMRGFFMLETIASKASTKVIDYNPKKHCYGAEIIYVKLK